MDRYFGDSYSIGNTIRQITPYILAGLAVAFAFRTGLFNIGVEGQLILGWLAAAWVGYAFELPKIIHLPLALLAAAAAGAFWAFIAGFLKAKFKVHEVIATIMLNYTALYIANAVIKNCPMAALKQNVSMSQLLYVLRFKRAYRQFKSSLWDHCCTFNGSRDVVHSRKTTRGYELKAVGFNKNAADYAGMSVNKNIILAMTISGMFAGLGGAMEALGTFQNASIKPGFTGIGFDGIAVALLGANTPLGVVFGASLFGSLKYGALNMPNAAGIPEDRIHYHCIDYLLRCIRLYYSSRLTKAEQEKGGTIT